MQNALKAARVHNYMKKVVNSLSEARVRKKTGRTEHVVTYRFDKFKGEGVEDHIKGLAGTIHHPEIDEQAESVHEQLRATVDVTSDG